MSNIRVEFDKNLIKDKKYILGIDEVGWGCVAGPLILGGCLLSREFYENYDSLEKESEFYKKIKDSKKVSEKDRIKIFESIKKDEKIKVFFGQADVDYINDYGLAKSYSKAIDDILIHFKNYLDQSIIIIDGNRDPKSSIINDYSLIIKGDDKSFSIGVASLFAKETRDNYMRELESQENYKKYSFSKHKGYGTKDHINEIKKNGLSKEHRVLSSNKLLTK